ncbi:hypothetical protein GTY54_27210, partial [Streptomyces sp. SID625]|nr:hypothetical protein [Streptomyces sp. SID625]
MEHAHEAHADRDHEPHAAGGTGTRADPGTDTVEELLREQSRLLRELKVRAGDPSLRAIEKRAAKLFADERASLPPATQSTLFNGGYTGLNKLVWLVRALMSWDRYGKECAPPAYGAAELDPWHERWMALTQARAARRSHRAASARTAAAAGP